MRDHFAAFLVASLLTAVAIELDWSAHGLAAAALYTALVVAFRKEAPHD
jgi:hypothetical protein